MMEAARTSETSVDIQLRTRQYIPEDSELHTRRRENLKSHIACSYLKHLKGSLTRREMLHGASGFTSHPKEGVLRDFHRP
jgi:hypothetical protein